MGYHVIVLRSQLQKKKERILLLQCTVLRERECGPFIVLHFVAVIIISHTQSSLSQPLSLKLKASGISVIFHCSFDVWPWAVV